VLDWEEAFAWNRHADVGNMLRYEVNGSRIEQHFIKAYEVGGNKISTITKKTQAFWRVTPRLPVSFSKAN